MQLYRKYKANAFQITDQDTDEDYTDHSTIHGEIPSLPPPPPSSTSTSSDEGETHTDISTRISARSRLGGRRQRDESQRDDSTVFSAPGKTDIDSDQRSVAVLQGNDMLSLCFAEYLIKWWIIYQSTVDSCLLHIPVSKR